MRTKQLPRQGGTGPPGRGHRRRPLGALKGPRSRALAELPEPPGRAGGGRGEDHVPGLRSRAPRSLLKRKDADLEVEKDQSCRCFRRHVVYIKFVVVGGNFRI